VRFAEVLGILFFLIDALEFTEAISILVGHAFF